MQFNEQVLTALEVLRNFAENDFEKHRIDVLEKDLTNPPKVEQVDDTHQKFNGVVYVNTKDGHYVNHNAMHQSVYRYYCGEIPKGYEIHHKDENKSNNDISNLQMLTKSEHCKLHSKDMLQKGYLGFKVVCKCANCGKFFEASKSAVKNRFCSRACTDSYHYKKAENQETRICDYCGKTFQVYKHSRTRFCSHSCAGKAKKR